jgi:hypothetical protein
MKTSAVKKIFTELTNECNNYPDGVSMNIDCTNFTTYFCICGDTEWSIDEEDNTIRLETNEGTEWIDIESITRIRI